MALVNRNLALLLVGLTFTLVLVYYISAPTIILTDNSHLRPANLLKLYDTVQAKPVAQTTNKERGQTSRTKNLIDNSKTQKSTTTTASTITTTASTASTTTPYVKKLTQRYQEKTISNDPYHASCYNPPANKRVTHPMNAEEIAQKVSERFEVSDRTMKDIKEALELNILSINKSEADNIKIILGYHGYEHSPHYTWYNFTHCEYTNCIALNPHRAEDHPMAPDNVAKAASIILFNLVEMYRGSTLPKIPRRHDQYFGVTSLESTGYPFNLMPQTLDGKMNMTVTYDRSSTVPEWHIFKACMRKREKVISAVNYAKGKTKGALVYVSNCYSMQYNRLSIMRMLANYVPVDIYGGCGQADPCRGQPHPADCRRSLQSQYRFYLAFENSLCKDYISEKFWDRLSEPDYMLPVAMGGLSVQEYIEQAPEDSFIHLRNFTSVAKLGRYLRKLMKDDKAYNKYHKWRESWEAFPRPIYTRFPSCDLCRIANEKPYMPADNNLSQKYNDPSRCSNYDPDFGKS